MDDLPLVELPLVDLEEDEDDLPLVELPLVDLGGDEPEPVAERRTVNRVPFPRPADPLPENMVPLESVGTPAPPPGPKMIPLDLGPVASGSASGVVPPVDRDYTIAEGAVNLLGQIAERGSQVLGGLPEFAADAGRNMEEVFPLGGFTDDPDSILPKYLSPEEYRAQVDPEKEYLENISRSMRTFETGHDEMVPWAGVKGDWKNVDDMGGLFEAVNTTLKFMGEKAITSLPDMVAALANPYAYFTARTGEIGQERAERQGRAQPTGEDTAIAGTVSAFVAAAERFGAQQIFQGVPGESLSKAVTRGVAAEGGTEAIQEPAEYLGTDYGRDDLSLGQALERSLQGFLGGAGAGGTIAGASNIIDEAALRAEQERQWVEDNQFTVEDLFREPETGDNAGQSEQPQGSAPNAPPVTGAPVPTDSEPPSPTPQQAEGEGASSFPSGSYTVPNSRKSVATANNDKVETELMVVEAADLITSDDTERFPAKLQPRDRGNRASSDSQIAKLAAKLDPERLGPSAEADRGAPIVGPDGVVESGNGRVAAIRKVFAENADKASDYRAMVEGLTEIEVSDFTAPVLVRVRRTDMTPEQRQAFTVAANESSTASMSDTERAEADVPLLDGIIDLLKPGEVTSLENGDFRRAFLGRLNPAEMNSLLDADGELSQVGKRRLNAAVLAKAYGGTRTGTASLERMLESPNDNIKSISNGMLYAAPAMAQLRDKFGGHKEWDFSEKVVKAAEKVAEIRGKGSKKSIQSELGQTDMYGQRDPVTDELMKAFYNTDLDAAASAERIGKILTYAANEAAKQAGNIALFDEDQVFAEDLISEGKSQAWPEAKNKPEGVPPTGSNPEGEGETGPGGGRSGATETGSGTETGPTGELPDSGTPESGPETGSEGRAETEAEVEGVGPFLTRIENDAKAKYDAGRETYAIVTETRNGHQIELEVTKNKNNNWVRRWTYDTDKIARKELVKQLNADDATEAARLTPAQVRDELAEKYPTEFAELEQRVADPDTNWVDAAAKSDLTNRLTQEKAENLEQWLDGFDRATGDVEKLSKFKDRRVSAATTVVGELYKLLEKQDDGQEAPKAEEPGEAAPNQEEKGAIEETESPAFIEAKKLHTEMEQMLEKDPAFWQDGQITHLHEKISYVLGSMSYAFYDIRKNGATEVYIDRSDAAYEYEYMGDLPGFYESVADYKGVMDGYSERNNNRDTDETYWASYGPRDDSRKYPFSESSKGDTSVSMDDKNNPMPVEYRTSTDWYTELFSNDQETLSLHRKPNHPPVVTQKEADMILEGWNVHIGDQNGKVGIDGKTNGQRTVIFLFEESGIASQPWVDAGYTVYSWDVKNGVDISDVGVEVLYDQLENADDVYAVFAFPPCTVLSSSSNARSFEAADKDGRTEAAKQLVFDALDIVEKVRPKFWMIENPRGSRIGQSMEPTPKNPDQEKWSVTGLGKPAYNFSHFHFGDDFNKPTSLWGNFPVDRIPTASLGSSGKGASTTGGGKSRETKRKRSKFPVGFSTALFMGTNYLDSPDVENLHWHFPYSTGAIDAALAAGMTPQEVYEAAGEHAGGLSRWDEGDGTSLAIYHAMQDKTDTEPEPGEKGSTGNADVDTQMTEMVEESKQTNTIMGNKHYGSSERTIKGHAVRVNTEMNMLTGKVKSKWFLDGEKIRPASLRKTLREIDGEAKPKKKAEPKPKPTNAEKYPNINAYFEGLPDNEKSLVFVLLELEENVPGDLEALLKDINEGFEPEGTYEDLEDAINRLPKEKLDLWAHQLDLDEGYGAYSIIEELIEQGYRLGALNDQISDWGDTDAVQIDNLGPGGKEARKRRKRKGRSIPFRGKGRGIARSSRAGQIWVDAGKTPEEVRIMPVRQQWAIAAEQTKKRFGFKAVTKGKDMNWREALDQIMEVYQNAQLMFAMLGMTPEMLSFNGKAVSLTLYRKSKESPTAAAYHMLNPGNNTESYRSKDSGWMIAPGEQELGLGRRWDSLAHEWGHALDGRLLEDYAASLLGRPIMNTPAGPVEMGRLLTGKIRLLGISEAPELNTEVANAMAELLNALFFDEAQLALYLMDLDQKINNARNPNSKRQKEFRKQRDAVAEGMSKARGIDSPMAKAAKDQGKSSEYYSRPTEMFARAFETYIAYRAELQAIPTEAMAAPDSFYRMRKINAMVDVYPAQKDRQRIFDAFDTLLAALTNNSMVTTAKVPGPDKSVMAQEQSNQLPPGDRKRSMTVRKQYVEKRERDRKDNQKIRDKERRDNRWGPEPPSGFQRTIELADDFYNRTPLVKELLPSVRGNIEHLIRRYPGSTGLKTIKSIFSSTPGSGTYQTLPFENERRARQRAFTQRLATIEGLLNRSQGVDPDLALYKLLTAPEGEYDKVLAKHPDIAPAAAEARLLMDDLWNWLQSVGVDVNYALNYLPRIIDIEKLAIDPIALQEFIERATDVYMIVFDRDIVPLADLQAAESEAVKMMLALTEKYAESGHLTAEAMQLYEAVKIAKAELRTVKAQIRKARESGGDLDVLMDNLEQAEQQLADSLEPLYADVMLIWAEGSANDWKNAAMAPVVKWNEKVGITATQDTDFLKQRYLPPETDSIMGDSLIQSTLGLMSTYITRATHIGMLHKSIGSPSEKKGSQLGWRLDEAFTEMERDSKVSNGELQHLQRDIAMMLGMYSSSLTTEEQQKLSTFSGVSTAVIISRSIFSQLHETQAISARYSGAGENLEVQMRPYGIILKELMISLNGVLKKYSKDRLSFPISPGILAEAAWRREWGAITGVYNDAVTEEIMAARYSLMHQSPLTAKITANFFKWSGIWWHTDKLRLAAAQMSFDFITIMANKALKGNNDARLALLELGIERADVIEAAAAMHGMRDAKAIQAHPMFDFIFGASAKFVNEAVVDPAVIDKPTLASMPEYGILRVLQSFLSAFMDMFVVPTAKIFASSKYSNDMKLARAVGLLSLIGLGTIMWMIREAIFGRHGPDDDEYWEKFDPTQPGYWMSIMSRIGMFGNADPIINAVSSTVKYESSSGRLLTGAYINSASDAVDDMLGIFKSRNSEETLYVERQAFKGAYYLTTLALNWFGLQSPLAPIVPTATAIATSPAAKEDLAIWLIGKTEKEYKRDDYVTRKKAQVKEMLRRGLDPNSKADRKKVPLAEPAGGDGRKTKNGRTERKLRETGRKERELR